MFQYLKRRSDIFEETTVHWLFRPSNSLELIELAKSPNCQLPANLRHYVMSVLYW